MLQTAAKTNSKSNYVPDKTLTCLFPALTSDWGPSSQSSSLHADWLLLQADSKPIKGRLEDRITSVFQLMSR